jgi:hypothetical protein
MGVNHALKTAKMAGLFFHGLFTASNHYEELMEAHNEAMCEAVLDLLEASAPLLNPDAL